MSVTFLHTLPNKHRTVDSHCNLAIIKREDFMIAQRDVLLPIHNGLYSRNGATTVLWPDQQWVYVNRKMLHFPCTYDCGGSQYTVVSECSTPQMANSKNQTKTKRWILSIGRATPSYSRVCNRAANPSQQPFVAFSLNNQRCFNWTRYNTHSKWVIRIKIVFIVLLDVFLVDSSDCFQNSINGNILQNLFTFNINYTHNPFNYLPQRKMFLNALLKRWSSTP